MDQVSESLADKIETAFYKCKVVELSAQLEWARVTVERDKLIDRAQKEVGAPDEFVYNLDKRMFVEKES